MATSFDLPAGIDQVLRDAFNEFSTQTNLTGVDFGFRYRDGRRTDELALRFHVPAKIRSEASLGEALLPAQYRDYKTDVLSAPLDFTHGRVAVDQRTKRHNPLQPGLSVSHGNQGAGTLGAIVFRQEDGAPAILSCWHVLAHPQARRGDTIYQPSLVDQGDIRFDGIGNLEEWLIDGDGDAAIALLNRSRILKRDQFETSAVLAGARRVRGGEVLTKSGRGTNVTRALVDGIGLYQIQVVGNFPPTLIQGFHLVPVDGAEGEISSFGDSGSIWYSTEPNGDSVGVGLHIDGEHTDDAPEFAIACHLPVVLDRLGVSLTPPPAALKGDQAILPMATFITWAGQNVGLLKELTASVEATQEGWPGTNGKDHAALDICAPAGVSAPSTLEDGGRPN